MAATFLDVEVSILWFCHSQKFSIALPKKKFGSKICVYGKAIAKQNIIGMDAVEGQDATSRH